MSEFIKRSSSYTMASRQNQLSKDPLSLKEQNTYNYISLPLENIKKIDPRTNVPITKCKAVAISGGIQQVKAEDNAAREEALAMERVQKKVRDSEEFIKKTQERVRKNKLKAKQDLQAKLDDQAVKMNKIRTNCEKNNIGACKNSKENNIFLPGSQKNSSPEKDSFTFNNPIEKSDSPEERNKFEATAELPDIIDSVLKDYTSALKLSEETIKHSSQTEEIIKAQAKSTAKLRLSQDSPIKPWNPPLLDEKNLKYELVRKIANINEHHANKEIKNTINKNKKNKKTDCQEKEQEVERKIVENVRKIPRFVSVDDMKIQFNPKIVHPKKPISKNASGNFIKNYAKNSNGLIFNEGEGIVDGSLEQNRYSIALKVLVRDKMKEKFPDDVPVVCTCGIMSHKRSAKDNNKCANNCPFYQRQEYYQTALKQMLTTFKASE
ncbi:hypothetical protein SteCoe_4424 [Stentor coeruleus]|uniref:Uncharacterized protein n=1 Tax=Stentor coeruleus TaxID=5963 RepID=A0A1R2CUV4_9CILI|nr:hypothetical protein SteCoe_4424 [Stentor coeruleus]